MDARTSASRELLHRSDALMDAVEQLRTLDRTRVPKQIRDAMAQLAWDVYGREHDRRVPTTTADAHRFLFAPQGRLLGTPTPTRRRPIVGSSRRVTGDAWKVIELPAGDRDVEWRKLAGLTVQRALDRFQLVRGQAVHLARQGKREQAARLWLQVEAAWANYWRLAEQLREPEP
jgi:hypothetical protein